MIILEEKEVRMAVESAFKCPKDYREIIDLILDRISEMQMRQGHSVSVQVLPKLRIENGLIE